MKVLKEGVKLYEHQKKALNLLNKNNSYGLFLEQGLGKTLIGLCDITRKVYKNPSIKNILIVAPISVKGAWERDLNLLTDEARYLIKDKLTITNYEQLIATKSHKTKKNSDGKPLRILTEKAEMYQKTRWDYIILDEGHKIKDSSTSTHKAIIKMGLKATYKYILTGTPVVNGNLINFWSYDTFMNTEINRGRAKSKHFGTITEFKNKFAILDQWYNPKQYIKTDVIMDIMKQVSVRMFKKDYLDLPDMLEPEIYELDMNPKQLDYYERMATRSTLLELDLLAENGVSRLNYLRQISNGFLYLEKETSHFSDEKIKALKDILENSEEPLVIFYNFTAEGDQITKLLKKMKIKFHKLDGKTKQSDRSNWRLFQEDDSRVYLSQVNSGARGIDLYKSSTIVYYSLPLSSEVFEQSKARTHRVGMKNIPASYIILAVKDSVEMKIYESLSNYMDFNEVMFEQYIETYKRGQEIIKA